MTPSRCCFISSTETWIPFKTCFPQSGVLARTSHGWTKVSQWPKHPSAAYSLKLPPPPPPSSSNWLRPWRATESHSTTSPVSGPPPMAFPPALDNTHQAPASRAPSQAEEEVGSTATSSDSGSTVSHQESIQQSSGRPERTESQAVSIPPLPPAVAASTSGIAPERDRLPAEQRQEREGENCTPS